MAAWAGNSDLMAACGVCCTAINRVIIKSGPIKDALQELDWWGNKLHLRCPFATVVGLNLHSQQTPGIIRLWPVASPNRSSMSETLNPKPETRKRACAFDPRLRAPPRIAQGPCRCKEKM